MMKLVSLVSCCLFLSACATTASVVDRSDLTISDNSRIVARNVIPNSAAHGRLVEHLGLAQEVYQKQLTALKLRRNTLRTRTRALDATSFAAFTLTTLGVGVTAIATTQRQSSDHLQSAGYAALGGLAVGTLLKVFGYMQEEPAAIDVKIRQLQTSYDGMLERVRILGEDTETDHSPQMAAAVEAFITQAMQIDVKG